MGKAGMTFQWKITLLDKTCYLGMTVRVTNMTINDNDDDHR